MKLKITVHGVAYEVEVEVLDPGEGFAPAGPLPPQRARSATPRVHPSAASSNALAAAPASDASSKGAVHSPIGGTVVEVKCKAGDRVEKDQVLLVIDAMKMNTSIASPLAGTVARVNVAAGDTVRENQSLVEID